MVVLEGIFEKSYKSCKRKDFILMLKGRLDIGAGFKIHFFYFVCVRRAHKCFVVGTFWSLIHLEFGYVL